MKTFDQSLSGMVQIGIQPKISEHPQIKLDMNSKFSVQVQLWLNGELAHFGIRAQIVGFGLFYEVYEI